MARKCPSAGARQANQVQVEGVDDILVARVEGVGLGIEGSMRPAIAVKTRELQKPQIVGLASGHRMFTGNVDSGAEISVVRGSLLPDYQPSGAKIRMTGAFGQQVTADLAYVPLRLRDEPPYVTYGPDEVGILCAVTDKLASGIDVLLTPDAYEQLLERTAQVPELDTSVEVLKPQEGEDGQARFKMDDVITQATTSAVQCGQTGDAPDVGERARFRDSLMKDPTLKEGREQAVTIIRRERPYSDLVETSNGNQQSAHGEENGTSAQKCVNCQRAHEATSTECPKLQKEKETCKVKVRENITFLEAAKVVEEQRKIKRRNNQHVEKPGAGTSQPKSQTAAQGVDPGAQGSSSPAGAAKADNLHNGGRDNHARGLTYRDVTQGSPPNPAADRKKPRYHPETQGILSKQGTSIPESAERSTASKFISLVFNTVRRLLELLPPSEFRTTLNSLLFLEGLLGAVF
ncbi:hypothetical protein ISCGN_016921 [Ixodes scapularis]